MNTHQPSKKIKVMIADDHHLFRSGLRVILEAARDFQVLPDAENGATLLENLQKTVPDVVLLDLEMPVMDGMDALRILHRDYPDILVLLVTMHNKESLVQWGMERGASGYVLKDSPPAELLKAIRQTVRTGYYFNDRTSLALLHGLGKELRQPDAFNGQVSFTPSELRVLQLICQEHTTPEIAERLHLSPRTVEGYRQKLLEKTDARNTAGLVVFAAQHGLLEQWVKDQE